MATLTRIRLGFFPTIYGHVLKKQPINFPSIHKVLFHCTQILDVAGQPIKMPSLSPTMSEGTIVKWLKKEGDTIAAGDVLCDIQTDKAVVSLETEEDGILAKIIVPENTADVKVGTLIALMVAEGEDWRSVEMPGDATVAPPAPAAAPAPEAQVASGPPTIQIKMPSLSPTMAEGTIVKWLKKEGDTVSPGDVLCDIQTDKAVMSLETEEEGVLAKILVPDDTKDVKIGTLIALIVAEGEDWKAVVVPSKGAPAAAPAAPAAPSRAPTATKDAAQGQRVKFGPAVRALLERYQLQPAAIPTSDRKNRLLKEHVMQYIAQNALQPKSPQSVPPPAGGPAPKSTGGRAPGGRKSKYTDIELSNVRKVIAKRLSQSKREIPHSYSVVQCNIDKLLEQRKCLKNENIKVSINDFVIKAVASALEACPEVNAQYTDGVKLLTDIDISIAVATDTGLITPILRGANRKGVADISAAVKDLAGRARAGKLKPQEFTGGSFTISNLGMFGINEFSAIINPPQCAILAVGGGLQRLGPNLKPCTDIRAQLSYDRRAIEDDVAAKFLQALKERIEDPHRILVGAASSQPAKPKL